MQRCDGVQVQFRRSSPKGQRIARIAAGGKPMEERRQYTVATSGGRTQYRDPQARATRRPAVEELIDYIRGRSPIQAELSGNFTEVR